jgi:hypothetical protein
VRDERWTGVGVLTVRVGGAAYGAAERTEATA